ncbi:MAG: radical SAM family heme chaperone HemW [Bacteroidales bacterium]
MSSVYIHIPFCASRCLYCDFYSTTTKSDIQESYLNALKVEFRQRISELGGEMPNTIYIGGGTPSQFKGHLLLSLFDDLSKNFDISACREITIEVNPDDINPEYINTLAATPVNRISMGVQSFCDAELNFLGRRHDSAGAINAFNLLRNAGYKNISIDLIFSLPGQTTDIWNANLQQAINLNPEHISAYNLSYEAGTRITGMLEAGVITECDEERSFAMYNSLIDILASGGYEQYEISNFAKSGLRSYHNSGYWSGVHYLGIGAAAHSYDGNVRRANINDITEYIKKTETGEIAYTEEEMTCAQRYNEIVYTSLRTMDGINLSTIERLFGTKYLYYCTREADRYIKSGDIIHNADRLILTRKGVFVSDAICRNLFYVE